MFLCFVSDVRMFEEKNIDFIQRPKQSNDLLFGADILFLWPQKYDEILIHYNVNHS